MANGDSLIIGVTQPPDNRATSATMLVHNGSAFGTQNAAFWVTRVGAPGCEAAIRAENFSTGAVSGGTQAGVLGMADASSIGVGVLGVARGQPNVFWGETGVLGVTNSFGVVGRSLIGPVLDEQGIFVSGTGVVGECNDGVGVHGTSTSGWGIIGQSFSRAGVTGKSVSGVGIEARSNQSHALLAASENGVGVLAGSNTGNGVLGVSRDAVGVEGVSIQGLTGILGRSDRSFGVIGRSNQGVGVAGVSQLNAIQGWSTGSGGANIGVVGSCETGQGVLGDSTTGIGIGGRSPRGWAGYFEGDVVVKGGFYVTGPKSAAVKNRDGTFRSVFSIESTESYLEDFGEVVLTGAAVTVRLKKDFAALVKRNKYQVFLTSYGPEALYVRKRNANGFEIARLDPALSRKRRTVSVGYRIVARRADLKPARLPKLKMPAQMAKMTKPNLTVSTANRKRTDMLGDLTNLDPLPAAPKIPSPDLKGITEAKPVDAK